MRFCTKTIAADGEKKQIAAKTDIFGDGITVVSADARCDKPLDARCAVLTAIECAPFDAATALERHSEYWCRPAFCASPADVPDETQLLLIKNGEKITVILPVVSDAYRTVLCGSGEAITAKTLATRFRCSKNVLQPRLKRLQVPRFRANRAFIPKSSNIWVGAAGTPCRYA